MQPEWKWCTHGSLRTHSPLSKSHRQTAHFSPTLQVDIDKLWLVRPRLSCRPSPLPQEPWPSAKAGATRTSGKTLIWQGVAASIFGTGACSASAFGAKSSREASKVIAVRAAERSSTEEISMLMPGQSSQSLLCIHHTTPSTNQPYRARETILLMRHAGDAVSDTMQSSIVQALPSLRMLAKSTARTGIWLI